MLKLLTTAAVALALGVPAFAQAPKPSDLEKQQQLEKQRRDQAQRERAPRREERKAPTSAQRAAPPAAPREARPAQTMPRTPPPAPKAAAAPPAPERKVISPKQTPAQAKKVEPTDSAPRPKAAAAPPAAERKVTSPKPADVAAQARKTELAEPVPPPKATAAPPAAERKVTSPKSAEAPAQAKKTEPTEPAAPPKAATPPADRQATAPKPAEAPAQEKKPDPAGDKTPQPSSDKTKAAAAPDTPETKAAPPSAPAARTAAPTSPPRSATAPSGAAAPTAPTPPAASGTSAPRTSGATPPAATAPPAAATTPPASATTPPASGTTTPSTAGAARPTTGATATPGRTPSPTSGATAPTPAVPPGQQPVQTTQPPPGQPPPGQPPQRRADWERHRDHHDGLSTGEALGIAGLVMAPWLIDRMVQYREPPPIGYAPRYVPPPYYYGGYGYSYAPIYDEPYEPGAIVVEESYRGGGSAPVRTERRSTGGSGQPQAQPVAPPPVVQLSEWRYDEIYRSGWGAAEAMRGHVVNQRGEQIGRLRNVIIGPEDRAVSVLVEIEGQREGAESLINVSWDQVRLQGREIVEVPVAGQDVSRFSLFGRNNVLAGALAGISKDSSPAQRTWKATDLINDYVTLADGSGFGVVGDVVFDPSGHVQAVVVTRDVAAGGGSYAVPFYGAPHGFDPWLPYYALPYDGKEMAGLQQFDEGRLQ